MKIAPVFILTSLCLNWFFVTTHTISGNAMQRINKQSIEENTNLLFKQKYAHEIEILNKHIALHNDFPKPGVCFADFSPLLNNASAFHLCIDLLYERYKSYEISAVVGLESRGFIIGAALAYKLGVGFVPVRKPGKIPGPIYSATYEKEYGTDTLCIAQNALQSKQQVLIVDDVIATGGSARAAIELVRKTGALPIAFATLLQVQELAKLAQLDIPAFNLIN